ncbi:DUF6300 family protein [Streptomyces sp. DT203]|uniref:DUF6300 family protein n=1 Tax=Streptomyces sp. DT203 TaxID=3393424 RepID=UPI003CF47CC5
MGPGPVSARFPHSWKNASCEEVPGMREATLCPVCDRDEPAADKLLAFFAVHKTLEPSELENFSPHGPATDHPCDPLRRPRPRLSGAVGPVCSSVGLTERSNWPAGLRLQ